MPSVVFTGISNGNTALLNDIAAHLTTTALGAEVVLAANNVGDGGVNNLKFKTTSAPQLINCVATSATQFTVSGTATGSLGIATVGTEFDHAQIAFTIDAGATPFASGDTIAITTKAWTENKVELGGVLLNTTGGVAPNNVTGVETRYLQGPGLAGIDSIYVNISSYNIVGTDVYNWTLHGATNFDDLSTVNNQPGASRTTVLALWQNSIQYWLIANGRRFILICKVSGFMFSAYCGFILPYGTNSEYPYPLMIAGNTTNMANRHSVAGYAISNFWVPVPLSSRYRKADGVWVDVASRTSGGNATNIFNSAAERNILTLYNQALNVSSNIDGSYSLLQPQLILKNINGGWFEGVLDGLQWVSGFANASEDTVQPIGYVNEFLIVQNASRTVNSEFAAIELG